MADLSADQKQKDDATGGVPFGPPIKPTDLGTLGQYRVIRQIGRGGMGMVFLGLDPKLRRRVALKVMLPKYLVKSAARDRFLREARAVAAIKNDHVVTIYQVDESNGVPFLALEYLQGATLEAYLRAGQTLSISQMLHVARDAANGLAAAHEHGVVHRDIKPDNIWLEAPEGRVKLIDFGLARVSQQDASATSEGLVVGTPAYMSPEQARGLVLDARTDLFSLGAVIYRLVAGVPPFIAETSIATIMRLTNDPHVPLIQKVPNTPEALSILVDRLLAKDPNDRPPSAKEVARELKRISTLLRTQDATAIPMDAEHNAWASLETESPGATPSISLTRLETDRRRNWYWLAGGVAMVFLAIVIMAMLWKNATGNTSAAEPKKLPASKAPALKSSDPFSPIFNGKDFTGWVATDKTSEVWKISDGILTGQSDGTEQTLLTEPQFGNFEFRFEYRWPMIGGDSGIILCTGDGSQAGLELQLINESQRVSPFPKFRHGAILNLQQPSQFAAKTSGEWNAVRLTLRAGKIAFEENGTVIQTQDFAAFAERKAFRERHPGLFDGKSRIGLQIKAGSVEFRTLRIKEN